MVLPFFSEAPVSGGRCGGGQKGEGIGTRLPRLAARRWDERCGMGRSVVAQCLQPPTGAVVLAQSADNLGNARECGYCNVSRCSKTDVWDSRHLPCASCRPRRRV